MLATAGVLPAGESWAYEVKWDGIRGLAATTADGVRLRSRNRRDLTADYPELAQLELPPRLLLDTEIVALDDRGVSDFELLQQRLHHTRPSPALVESVPVSLMVFDVLRVDDASQLDQPYRDRRDLLGELDLTRPGRLAVPPHFTDIAAADVLAAVETQGLEGVVAKRLSSRYEPGRRSRAWIKHAIRHTCDVAVLGWAPASRHGGALGALVIGLPDDTGTLRYAGEVGTGFTASARQQLLELLTIREQDRPPVELPAHRGSRWAGATPADRLRWVRPGLVGEIAYRQRTSAGSFRHPSWRGLRPDRDLGDLRPPVL
ncbi:ATP-dependent DNA ligase clustered with Ku protein, LigD [Pseudonocardia sp. Ae717_Ps2]|nr:ATP-dependent DNA ligase clustered with Ku protein, LigD [Pseudonocardia sp. Ae717_Ps2]